MIVIFDTERRIDLDIGQLLRASRNRARCWRFATKNLL